MSAKPGLTVCRGCCCGTEAAHPGVDHAGQLARLQALATARGDASVHVSGCLDHCEEGGTVVVRPSAAQRRRGAAPVWLGRAHEDGVVEAIEGWVLAGGPGAASLPRRLRQHVLGRAPSARTR